MTKCSATTKTGKPCPVDARPSGLCHVHDPAVQCGAPTRSGRACEVPTGGGRCKAHADHLGEVERVLAMAQRAVADAVAAGVDRRRLTGIVGSAMVAMRAEVWPDAAPASLPDGVGGGIGGIGGIGAAAGVRAAVPIAQVSAEPLPGFS